MLSAEHLEGNLARFTGTENWTRHALARNMVMTDGVLYLREHADCHWLIDAIASYVGYSPELKGEHFQVWTFERTGDQVADGSKPHLLYATDGNDNRIATQEIGFSDFPLPKIVLWAVFDGGFDAFVLMLPSEY